MKADFRLQLHFSYGQHHFALLRNVHWFLLLQKFLSLKHLRHTSDIIFSSSSYPNGKRSSCYSYGFTMSKNFYRYFRLLLASVNSDIHCLESSVLHVCYLYPLLEYPKRKQNFDSRSNFSLGQQLKTLVLFSCFPLLFHSLF